MVLRKGYFTPRPFYSADVADKAVLSSPPPSCPPSSFILHPSSFRLSRHSHKKSSTTVISRICRLSGSKTRIFT
jgi:hypothetical protein